MPNVAGDAKIELKADVTEFKRLFGKSSDVDKKLMTALQRNIRVAGEKAADASRLTVDSGGASKTGLRMGIAAGIKVKVMTGARAGVTIVASSAQMPAGKQSMVRAWEGSKGWRHPVFGNTAAWVAQHGHPYFAKPIYDQRAMVRKAVEDAMVEAVKSLKGT
jgi:hypothetical protein